MKISNEVTELFNIKYPVIQAGMVWVSGWRLASAVSNCGGLGLIGSGSMKTELLKEHIQKCKAATENPFGVNIPLRREDASELVQTVIDENIQIVFTSAGHPGKFIDKLKSKKVKVVHVVPSTKYAIKAESVGCDAVVGEGVEAGGHNGIDEITIFNLIPMLADAVKIPVIAAGGIVNGRGILASLSLGAKGVQMGTRFAVTMESSAHPNYKKKIVEAKDNDTTLILKKIGLVRLLKNEFTKRILEVEKKGASEEELKELLGKKRERLGIFEGDENEGMMEAGQGAGLIKNIPTVEELFQQLLIEFDEAYKNLTSIE
ncbi:MAG: nitronate monooxygenase [Ignavibacteriales bacterium]|nr:nitronate monooxygenase [Ignavibacteriales bacterium]